MWKIKHIFDGEYGCEELAEGQRPKVSVTLINEKEEETCFFCGGRLADRTWIK